MLFNPLYTYDFNDMETSDKKNFLSEAVKDIDVLKSLSNAKLASESFPSKIPMNQLDDGYFALIIKEGGQKHRRFPINNPINALLSKLSFEKNYKKLPILAVEKTASSIRDACEFFGIECGELIKTSSSQNTSNEDMVDFDNEFLAKRENQLRIKEGRQETFALPTKNLYPLNTIREVKCASDFFNKNAKLLEEDGLCEEFASNLIDRQNHFGMKTNVLAEKKANRYVPLPQDAVKVILDERTRHAIDCGFNSEKIASISSKNSEIMEMSTYEHPDNIISMIKECDQKWFGDVRYQIALTNPKELIDNSFEIIKNASYIDLDLYNELLNPGADGRDVKMDMDSFSKKINENPNLIRGHFPEETANDIINDVGSFYQRANSDEKNILDKIYQKTI